MNPRHATPLGLAVALLACTAPLSAQTYDWGTWDGSGNASYANGDSISISGLVNGSSESINNENNLPHAIIDPSFPLSSAPGNNQFGHFSNSTRTTGDWSVLIDLSGFSLSGDSVIGFSNLDGRSYGTLAPGYATLEFQDSSGSSVSVSSASFLGSYDTYWQGIRREADSTFDLDTGRWDVIPDTGTTYAAGTYFAAVGDAFFLSNLPSNVARIVYTKSPSTDYVYDSTLFYAANPVPEPATALLAGMAGLCGLLRRQRRTRSA